MANNFDIGRLYSSRVVIRLTPGGAAPTYFPPKNCIGILVELIGSGGAGAGATSGANCAVGGGGAAGARVLKWIEGPFTVLDSIANGGFTYVIGNGGSGGNGDGGDGNDVTLTYRGVTYTAKGGLGGKTIATGTTNIFALGGAGVIGTNGDVNGAGEPGGYGERISGTVAVSGEGGSTEYGAGGAPTNTDVPGNAGTGYGAGGGGAVGFATNSAGGDGTKGCIIIYEFMA